MLAPKKSCQGFTSSRNQISLILHALFEGNDTFSLGNGSDTNLIGKEEFPDKNFNLSEQEKKTHLGQRQLVQNSQRTFGLSRELSEQFWNVTQDRNTVS